MDSVYRQLGEITATLSSFREDLAELKTSFGGLAKAQSTSAEDRRSQQQTIITRIEAIEKTASDQHMDNTKKLDSLVTDIATLKGPVSQFVMIRSWIGTLLVSGTAVIGVIWTLAEPVYTRLIDLFIKVH